MSTLRCPHCDAPSFERNSEQLSPLLRKSWYRCDNLACGHTFVSFTEIRYTLTPPATPRPGVWLPLSQHAQQRREMAEVFKLPTVAAQLPDGAPSQMQRAPLVAECTRVKGTWNFVALACKPGRTAA
ncbi:MAG: ogr/Delta-like zinc finger family protein [Hydrogenophaga sp.]|nr:ogr/Delta-like zinc finger family protein [Hydrogenophaga sp.]